MYIRRNDKEEIELVETKIWNCTSDDCNGWVRDNFKSKELETPICPLCKSKMEPMVKMLQTINNSRKF